MQTALAVNRAREVHQETQQIAADRERAIDALFEKMKAGDWTRQDLKEIDGEHGAGTSEEAVQRFAYVCNHNGGLQRLQESYDREASIQTKLSVYGPLIADVDHQIEMLKVQRETFEGLRDDVRAELEAARQGSSNLKRSIQRAWAESSLRADRIEEAQRAYDDAKRENAAAKSRYAPVASRLASVEATPEDMRVESYVQDLRTKEAALRPEVAAAASKLERAKEAVENVYAGWDEPIQ